MNAYVVSLMPSLPEPLRVTRVGDIERDVEVRGSTLVDAAEAILADASDGRRPALADAMAFSAIAFRGLGERGAIAVTVKGEMVGRFLDAARRVA